MINYLQIILCCVILFFLQKNCYSKNIKIRLSNELSLEETSFENLYGWNNENYKEALDVFLDNCERIVSLSIKYPIFPQANKKINKNDFYSVCKIADIIKNYNKEYIQVFFENYFIPFKIIDNKNNYSLFTGYYMPTIKAKRKKDNIFKYPIYKRPNDLVDGIKYYTREQINNGVLANKNLEILYTNDLVELFFFHIQGSGNVELVDENKIISIGFDGKNNHKYTSIGKYMSRNNLLTEAKADTKSIKQELKKNLVFAKNILNVNKSYIFFKILEDNNFKGAFGSKLVPFRTIAVDKKYIPYGFPIWLNTMHIKKYDIREQFNKLVIANDTGSAIKGVVRGDIFFGFGEEGEENSGYQYSTGEMYLLIPIKVLKKINIEF